MMIQVKVRVNAERLKEFGGKLLSGELDRSCIRGETYCIADEPEVGFSYWETKDMREFESKFSGWREYYSEVSLTEMIPAAQAQKILMSS